MGERIRDEWVTAYHEATVAGLRERGFCAFFDGEEVAAKRSNDFSEQYDIVRTPAAGGYYVMLAYMGTCRPAWSAIP